MHKSSVWARRFRDLLSLHLSDLGGEDNCSEAEKAIIRRAACLIVELEIQESKFAMAGDGASDTALKIYGMSSNTLRRLLAEIGVQRRPRDVTPTLEEVARDYSKRKAAVDVDDVEEEVTG